MKALLKESHKKFSLNVAIHDVRGYCTHVDEDALIKIKQISMAKHGWGSILLGQCFFFLEEILYDFDENSDKIFERPENSYL